MYPEIFGLSFLHTYGVLVAAALLVGLWLAGRLSREAGLNAGAVTDLGLYCALAAIGGPMFMMFGVVFSYNGEHRGEIFPLNRARGGGVFYGVLIGALGVAV